MLSAGRSIQCVNVGIVTAADILKGTENIITESESIFAFLHTHELPGSIAYFDLLTFPPFSYLFVPFLMLCTNSRISRAPEPGSRLRANSLFASARYQIGD
ncbi:hypothetical protein PILCRDRAFT_828061 [Piloderma croceum F 1598]|uniref:Uncharacterized protein n=1 Tax=Piloderma croceum (strain F 1598) TaxID=765440 RepID=A0A0C3F437_PILCF|nr:hypothetical protein PILCRDRAFT_828061 [Piloderma croceum F 1598]